MLASTFEGPALDTDMVIGVVAGLATAIITAPPRCRSGAVRHRGAKRRSEPLTGATAERLSSAQHGQSRKTPVSSARHRGSEASSSPATGSGAAARRARDGRGSGSRDRHRAAGREAHRRPRRCPHGPPSKKRASLRSPGPTDRALRSRGSAAGRPARPHRPRS